MKKRFKLRIVSLSMCLTFAMLIAIGPNALALTITRNFIGGAPQANTTGGGNLIGIFDAAADKWERAILDPFDITLNFGWAPVGGANHALNAQGGTPNRETKGTILFNNTASNLQWFMDSTPNQNEEYQTFTETFADLGGGSINTGRFFTDPVFPFEQGRFDLLSTALHEIGHSLGMSMAHNSFIAETLDLDIDVTAPLPFAGTTLQLRTNNFGVVSHFADLGLGARPVMGSYDELTRYILSEVDILAMAQISGFTNLNLNPKPIPEPTTIALLSIGLAGLAGAEVRRRRKKKAVDKS
jgi:hypothetical protein